MKTLTPSNLKKYAKKSVPALLVTATKYFNRYIRLRDSEDGYGTCISSGRPLKVPHYTSQAGHFYSAGHYPSLRFNEDNVHLQSLSDNYFKSGNLLEYRKNLEKKIGTERLKELDLLAEMGKRHSFKWDRFSLIDIIETYKEKCKYE